MMRYFPFFIISLIIYSLFFYYSQQLTPLIIEETIATQPTQINDKIINLDFEKQSQKIEIKKTQKEDTLSIAPSNSDKVVTPQTDIAPTPSQKTPMKDVPPETALKNESAQPEIMEIKITNKKPDVEVQADAEEQVDVIAEIDSSIPEETINNTSEKIIPVVKDVPLTSTELSALASDAALLKGEFYDNNFYLYIDKATPKKPSKTEALKPTQTKSNESAKSPAPKKLTTQIKKVFKPDPNKGLEGISEAIVASGNKPSYPEKALSNKLKGRVTVKFTVNIEGKSKAPQVISSSGHETLDQAVLDFVKRERFMPSFDGTQKVAKEQQYSFEFTEKQ